MDRSETAPLRIPHNTLYAKLGVPPGVSTEAIQRAYKVLEETYRPGGAYVDDVMHLAFTEISRAASILGNPKTRKLYDQGYIDEFGKRTKAGLARASRVRTAVLAGAFLSIGFAGLAIFGIGHSNGPLESASHINPPAQRAPQASLPVSMPRLPEQTQKSASDEKSGSQVPDAAPPLQADARDYLPPKTGMAQRVIPDMVLPKPHENWRLVLLFFPSVLRSKRAGEARRATTSQSGTATLSSLVKDRSANAAVLHMVWRTRSRFGSDAHLADTQIGALPGLPYRPSSRLLTSLSVIEDVRAWAAGSKAAESPFRA